MKWLVDANVLSEPTKPEPDMSVVEWLQANEADLVVDPFVVGEVRFGILLLPPGRRRRGLERWFADGVQRLHCIPWDAHTGSVWADLLARLRIEGHAMPIKDSLIAASALAHDLTLVTRNSRDFQHAGVALFDPFKSKG